MRSQARQLKVATAEETFFCFGYDEYEERPKIIAGYRFFVDKDNNITQIKLVLLNSNDITDATIEFNPIEWFLFSFWNEKVDPGPKLTTIGYKVASHFDGLKSHRYRFQKQKKDYSYISCMVIETFPNIWNEYCLHQGKSTIPRRSFCLWLYRLNCLTYDLIEKPLNKESDWKKRYFELANYQKSRYRRSCEYFRNPGWKKLDQKSFISREDAFRHRIDDSMKLLNDFNSSVEMKSAIEEFLAELYYDFSRILNEKELITQCPLCKEFIPYVKGKKYCSRDAEGRDCGKKARNQRYYEIRGKKNLHKYRRRTKELREYYKKMGVNK